MVDIDIPLSYEEDVRKVHTVMGQISEKISALDDIERSEYKGTEKFDEFAQPIHSMYEILYPF